MEDLRYFFVGMQDLNSKKQGGKAVCGIGHPPGKHPHFTSHSFQQNVVKGRCKKYPEGGGYSFLCGLHCH